MDYGTFDHPQCFPEEYIKQQWVAFADGLDAVSISAQNVSIALSGSIRAHRRVREALSRLIAR